MCPLCWAVIATNILMALAGVMAANLTDLKFGLWLSLAILGEVIWNYYAVRSGGDLMVIHPAVLYLQIGMGACRGAKLLEGEHWIKGLAIRIGSALGRTLLQRQARRDEVSRNDGTFEEPVGEFDSPKTSKGAASSLKLACSWIVGPVLTALVDLPLGAPLICAAAFMFGVRHEVFTIGESVRIGYVPTWIIVLTLAVAYGRGVVVLARRHDHWIRRFRADIVLGRKGAWHTQL